jgi:hypothetical protein
MGISGELQTGFVKYNILGIGDTKKKDNMY